MKYKFIITAVVLVSLIFIGSTAYKSSRIPAPSNKMTRFWEFQSIDTMKYSRDYAREKMSDPSFDIIIERQMKAIANTGATHVAIATPYDEEFYPMLERWVTMARKYHLKVWFRGNFSGWEGWFDYPLISREQHKQQTENFIKTHPNIFEDGDIFTACPECENGGPGDPRKTGDVEGHRKFLIEEHQIAQKTFKAVGKNVRSDFNSMNADEARLIMDKDTTKQLGGIVVIDHYVRDPEKLNNDIHSIAKQSGGKVVLGEYGVPIPDINGNLSEIEQAEWLTKAFSLLSHNSDLVGLNYWVNVGGSTQLWDASGQERPAVQILTKAYKPINTIGIVQSDTGKALSNAQVTSKIRSTQTNSDGSFSIPVWDTDTRVLVSADGYYSQEVTLNSKKESLIIMTRKNPSPLDKILRFNSKAKFFNLGL